MWWEEEGLDNLLYIVIGLLSILAILLLFSRNKILREKKEAERKLKDTLSDLDNVYSEINTTQEELNVKYREIKTGEDKIRKLAYEDSYTGLPNGVAFIECLIIRLKLLEKKNMQVLCILTLTISNRLMICGDMPIVMSLYWM